MTFELNNEELENFNTWKNNLPKLETVDVWGEKHQFTFSFYTMGLGVVKTVERTDGERIDLFYLKSPS